jgi:hypothetical protein
MSSPKLLLDYAGAAEVLSLSPKALRILVSRRRGPQIVRLGRRTMFAVEDLKAWVDFHKDPGSSDQSWVGERVTTGANWNEPLPVKNKRGRPKGSKNKPKIEAA